MSSELLLEWDFQHLCKEGEIKSGDSFIVKDFSDYILISVIDGLGHGEEAYNISTKAYKYISEEIKTINGKSFNSFFLSINSLLHGTRGAVMSAVIVNKHTAQMAWAGIGNIDGILFSYEPLSSRKYDRHVLRNGIIGFNIPEILIKNHQLKGGEILMLFTDGINNFNECIKDISYKLQYYSIKYVAKQIFNSHRNVDDDALFWIGKFKWNQ